MPGLVGFTRRAGDDDEARRVLQKMLSHLCHDVETRTSDLALTGSVAAAKCLPLRAVGTPDPSSGEDVQVWLDGEIWQLPGAGPSTSPPYGAPSLLRAYLADRNCGFLADIDGIFSAVIHDERSRRLWLITDRYGLRHIYWTQSVGSLLWASEQKALLEHPGYSPQLDPGAPSQFMRLGYLLGNSTWLRDVELLPPGSSLVWDLEQRSPEIRRYWDWSRIPRIEPTPTHQEAAEELGRLFRRAVAARTADLESPLIALSGGLDSRAILGAATLRDSAVRTYTFGSPLTREVAIAREAARRTGAGHQLVSLDHRTWLRRRIAGVWWTEGEQSLLHFHGIEEPELLRNSTGAVLNGLAGDLIAGGSYLRRNGLDRPLTRELAARLAHCGPDDLCHVEAYQDLPKTDYFFLDNRVRRFTICGAKHVQVVTQFRAPFYDNRLFEFLYGLPDAYRHRGRVYHSMLVEEFPDLFLDLPWESTGRRIPRGPVSRARERLLQWIESRPRLVHWKARWMTRQPGYTDYARWMRLQPAQGLFGRLLGAGDAHYPEFLSRERVIDAWRDHLSGRSRASFLGRVITLETWLRQLRQPEFRPDGEEYQELFRESRPS